MGTQKLDMYKTAMKLSALLTVFLSIALVVFGILGFLPIGAPLILAIITGIILTLFLGANQKTEVLTK